ncbi:MAG: SIS domain-containing protein [Bdellovibrionota bacterium]
MTRVKKITFIGTGSSFHAALWAHWLCQLSGTKEIASQALTVWDFLAAGACAAPGRDEFTVVISHRGNRGLTARALKTLSSSKRILLCAQSSPAGKHPFVYTSPPELSNAHTMSLTAAMAASSEVVAAVLPEKSRIKLRSQRKIAAQIYRKLADLSPHATQLEQLARKGRALFFVGGGPFYAIALELALKAKEMAHVPAHALGLEESLHGPITAVEKNDVVVLLGPSEPLKGGSHLKFLFSDRADRCASAAKAIGAQLIRPDYRQAFAEKPTKPIDMAWQSLLLLYWGQQFCLELSKRKGAHPDLNRRDNPLYEEARKRIEL